MMENIKGVAGATHLVNCTDEAGLIRWGYAAMN